MFIEVRGSLLNLVCARVVAFSLFDTVSRKKKARHLVLSLTDSREQKS